ncbi:MAG: hypothetical protein AAFO01_17670, partial [Pseudomonadota bacterium]
LYPDDILTMQNAIDILTRLGDCESFDRIEQTLERYDSICKEDGACSDSQKAFHDQAVNMQPWLRKQCVPVAQQ